MGSAGTAARSACDSILGAEKEGSGGVRASGGGVGRYRGRRAVVGEM